MPVQRAGHRPSIEPNLRLHRTSRHSVPRPRRSLGGTAATHRDLPKARCASVCEVAHCILRVRPVGTTDLIPTNSFAVTDEAQARRDTNELCKNSNNQKTRRYQRRTRHQDRKALPPRMIALISIHRRGQLLDTFPNEPLSSARFPRPRISLEGESGSTNSNCRIEKSIGESQPTPHPAELAAHGAQTNLPGD